jgi:adenine/guanine phosphoribosyltransferase-like PRPP-binding protein
VYNVEAFAKTVSIASKKIAKFREKHPFDAIAFTGTSGAALAYPLSINLKLPLICVRKTLDGNHYNRELEGVTNARTYLIVDDFIASGNTIRKITKTIDKNSGAKPAGIFLYSARGATGAKMWDGIPLLGISSDER